MRQAVLMMLFARSLGGGGCWGEACSHCSVACRLQCVPSLKGSDDGSFCHGRAAMLTITLNTNELHRHICGFYGGRSMGLQ